MILSARPKRITEHGAFGPGQARAARVRQAARRVVRRRLWAATTVCFALGLAGWWAGVHDRRPASARPFAGARVSAITYAPEGATPQPASRGSRAVHAGSNREAHEPVQQQTPDVLLNAARMVAGTTQVPWIAWPEAGPRLAPNGLPLAAPFIKWGRASETVSVYCRFRDPAYPAHTGLDLQVDPGAPVMATLAGTVAWAAENGSYGNLVVVERASVQTWFAHLARIDVVVGQDVHVNEAIGLSGGEPGAVGSGSSGGSHLHYAVRWRDSAIGRDFWLDPAAFIEPDASAYLGCSR